MQKFILLRGHEGSGKSTFAAAKIAEFLQQFPSATIVHIDNDAALTNENGEYHFDFEKFSAAHRNNMQLLQQTLQNGSLNRLQNILLINANPNQKAKTCYALLDLAMAHGFECEVYRLHNFFQNIHQVAEEDVLRGYLRLNANPVAGEIHIPAVCEMSTAQREQLALLHNSQPFQAA